MNADIKEKLLLKEIKKKKCVIHIKRNAYRMCESCHQPYCQEDIVESWSFNFLSNAFLAEKRAYNKQYLCKDCDRRKRKKSVLIATFLLVTFIILILGFGFQNSFK